MTSCGTEVVVPACSRAHGLPSSLHCAHHSFNAESNTPCGVLGRVPHPHNGTLTNANNSQLFASYPHPCLLPAEYCHAFCLHSSSSDPSGWPCLLYLHCVPPLGPDWRGGGDDHLRHLFDDCDPHLEHCHCEMRAARRQERRFMARLHTGGFPGNVSDTKHVSTTQSHRSKAARST
jgi:hypothetical protein